jgi:hypothetical protein
MKTLISLFFVLCTQLACADTIGLHLATWHSNNADSHLNNINPGVYYKSGSGWTAGYYYNSVRRNSFYVGKSYETQGLDGLSAGVIVAVVTGYADYRDSLGIHQTNALRPLIVPSAAYAINQNSRVRLTFLPVLEKRNESIRASGIAFHLSYEKKF